MAFRPPEYCCNGCGERVVYIWEAEFIMGLCWFCYKEQLRDKEAGHGR